MKSSDEERNRIANDKLKLVEVEALIENLENQLKNARNRRNSIMDSITRSENIIKENDKKIADARAKIDDLNKEIGALRDKANAHRRKCTELEIEVERLRTDINVAESKTRGIDDRIDDLNRRIDVEKGKLKHDDLENLRHMINSLSGLIDGVQREIDRQYYYCYGDGAVQTEQTGSVVVYIVRGESFGNYLLTVYGQSVKVPAVRGTYNLYRIDIFSPVWTSKFGASFSGSSMGGSSLSLGGDFSCTNNAGAQTGSGRISNISGNRIEV